MYANVIRMFRCECVREQLSLYLHRNTITFVMSSNRHSSFASSFSNYTRIANWKRILKANRELPSLRQRGDTILYFTYTAIRILTNRFNPRSTETNAYWFASFSLLLGKVILHLQWISSAGNRFLFLENAKKQWNVNNVWIGADKGLRELINDQRVGIFRIEWNISM